MTQTFVFSLQVQIVVNNVTVSNKLHATVAAMFVFITICTAFITFAAGKINK